MMVTSDYDLVIGGIENTPKILNRNFGVFYILRVNMLGIYQIKGISLYFTRVLYSL